MTPKQTSLHAEAVVALGLLFCIVLSLAVMRGVHG